MALILRITFRGTSYKNRNRIDLAKTEYEYAHPVRKEEGAKVFCNTALSIPNSNKAPRQLARVAFALLQER
ncbi:hypothetical protein [uncultured Roseobacter sp.]|uniref:hypothetical protein n=1 Tax=uncultured Roseobacter sp. TaxID=114847 RepID=UPI002622F98A|nr:hypothetical protein [uncultured Roseobacter sp.]